MLGVPQRAQLRGTAEITLNALIRLTTHYMSDDGFTTQRKNNETESKKLEDV